MMFFSSRIVFSTPPSLVNSYAKLLSLTMALGISTPIRLHVPEDRYAQLSPVPGTPSTAEAVSCEPTAMTGIFAQPISLATSSVNSPITVPGMTISGMMSMGRFSFSKIGADH